MLASLYESAGDYAKAEPLLTEEFQTLLSACDKALPAMAENQAFEWLGLNRPRPDRLLAAWRRTKTASDAEAYDRVWKSKALVTRLRLNQRLGRDASSAAQAAFAELRDARLRLARLLSSTPNAGQAAKVRQALTAASDDKERLEKKLASLNPGSARMLAIRDATVKQLIDRLPRGTAIVDVVRGYDWRPVERMVSWTRADGGVEKRGVKTLEQEMVYDAFILRSPSDAGRVAWAPLGAARTIDEAVAAWCSALTGEGPRDLTTSEKVASAVEADAALKLRQLVWDKLEPRLKGVDTVIMLPDGALTRVPWSALPGREPDTWLLNDYAVATASFGQQLFGLLSDEPTTAGGLLVAGGVLYDDRPETSPDSQAEAVEALFAQRRGAAVGRQRPEWPYLAGTRVEAEQVAKLFPDSQQPPLDVLTGNRASEQAIALLAPNARYLHLATHGFFAAPNVASIWNFDPRRQRLSDAELTGRLWRSTVAGRNPLLLSGVVLAGANLPPAQNELGLPIGDDGIFTAEEVASLDLRNTELVTLSACETGLGDVAAGEGVFGLQRAFHQAGARCVLASLWKVDDEATQALMTEFYRNLWQKKLGKLAALRAAQLKMIRDYNPTDGTIRGLKLAVRTKPGEERPKRLPPFYWAAFQLSGDWR